MANAVATKPSVPIKQPGAGPASVARSTSRGSRWSTRAIAILYVAILVLVPMIVVTYKTFDAGWSAFVDAVSSDDAVRAIKLTVEISLIAVAINTLFGVGFALLITRYRFRGRRLLGALADLPISISPIVVGLALVLVYGPYNGWFGKGLNNAGIHIIFSFPGMVLATAFVSMPLVLREIVPVLEEAGTDQEQAARVLGANGWQQFRRITVPIIGPALLYGIVLSLARALGEFGAVNVVGGNVSGASGSTQTLTLLINQQVGQFEPGYYQLAFVLIVVTVLAIVVVNILSTRRERRLNAEESDS